MRTLIGTKAEFIEDVEEIYCEQQSSRTSWYWINVLKSVVSDVLVRMLAVVIGRDAAETVFLTAVHWIDRMRGMFKTVQ
jgi:hypothetical protein